MHPILRALLAALVLAMLAGCSTFTVEADLSDQIAGKRREYINGRDVTGRPAHCPGRPGIRAATHADGHGDDRRRASLGIPP